MVRYYNHYTMLYTNNVQSFFGFGASAEVEIVLGDQDNRKKVEMRNDEGKKERLPLYYDGENVQGKVPDLLT